ncbi:MAG: Cell division protein ZapA [Pseudomonadota bacterium]|jgi:cell division protein ZapA
MSNRQIDVQIMGQSYILGCPDGGEERLMSAVRKVDEAMCKIRDAGKIKARDRIAVLAALNLAFEQSEAPAAVNKADRTPSASADESPDVAARLTQLLQRLDKVIEQDGQLL